MSIFKILSRITPEEKEALLRLRDILKAQRKR